MKPKYFSFDKTLLAFYMHYKELKHNNNCLYPVQVTLRGTI